ncbi:H-2 class I histocompatibility antigen, alpha chain-like isoform X2 [Lithobates pipiens]
MKVLITFFIVSFLLLLSIAAEGFLRLTCMQNVYFSNEQIQTAWLNLKAEDIEIAAWYNDTRIIEYKQSWAKTNISLFGLKFIDVLLLRYIDNAQKIFRKIDKKLGIEVQPQVYITKKPYNSNTEVICIVTGFYPKPINVSLWKESKMEDVMSTVTLPNGDGTYQITVLITVNLLEQQSVYCRVEHSSLKEPLIVYLDEEHHTPIGLVIGIIVAAVCAFGLACFVKLYKKRRRNTSIHGMTMDIISRIRE